jgi:hypothetical protein
MADRALRGIALDSRFDLDRYRAKLREMSENKLIEEGKTLAFLCSPRQNFGKPPKEQWALQLIEARAEWRRRKLASNSNSFHRQKKTP